MAVAGPHLAALMAGGGRPPAQAVLLAVLQDNYQVNADSSGDGYAVDWAVPGVAVPLKGRGSLRQRLAADMWQLTGMQPSQEALSTVLGTVEGWAAGARRVQPHLRVARTDDGRIAFDLGRSDGAAVLMNGGGWEICTRGLARFRRSAATAPLPDPVRGGRFPSLVNIRGRDELALYSACRVAAMLPWGTRPVELMTGQPGSAKTATMRTTVRWLGGYSTGMSRDPRDWVAIASNAHVLGHENVSGMTAERQDLLCKAASGHEHLARVLYSDADLAMTRFAPLSVVIEGVELGMLRTDFIRRSVMHELTRPDAYLSERGFEAQWEQEHPLALGWLCDATVSVLGMLPRTAQPAGDSLTDFAHVLTAIDALWGTRALELWRFDQDAMYAEMAEGDPVALAVAKVLTGPWQGKASELLELLREHGVLPGWAGPWTPRKLSASLVRSHAALTAGGWTMHRVRDGHTKSFLYTILPPGFSDV